MHFRRSVISAVAALLLGFAAVNALPAVANDAPAFTEVRRAVHTSSTLEITPVVQGALHHLRFELLSAPTAGSAAVSADGRHLLYAAPAISGADSFAYRALGHDGSTVDGVARLVVYDDAMLATCRANSTVTPAGVLNTRTKSNGCAFYGQTTTRVTADGTPVTMDYFVNWPSGGIAPKAAVVLIGGSDLNMAIRGNLATGLGDITGGANNFVVRTAQLLADAGYLTVALDRPVPGPLPPSGSTDLVTATDLYRVSVDHAVDILTVLNSLGAHRLPVFLVGTSRGSLSVVAQNLIATGISTSSSVTRDAGDLGRHLYVGRADIPNLLPQYVQRPTHVMWHADDACFGSWPTGSQALYDSLVAAGVDAVFHIASGGVSVTAAGNGVSPDVCGALSAHGYMGIENATVGQLSNWFDARVAALQPLRRAHGAPQAAFVSVQTSAGVPAQIHLSVPMHEGPGHGVRYALPGSATSLGGQAVLRGRTVTYTPPANVAQGTDYFVYVVTDRRGGVAAAVVSVRIGG